jgi:hypothetical protein
MPRQCRILAVPNGKIIAVLKKQDDKMANGSFQGSMPSI